MGAVSVDQQQRVIDACLNQCSRDADKPCTETISAHKFSQAESCRFVPSAGKLETFAERARIVHIDVDPAEINKNKEAHIPMCTETRPALAALNKGLDEAPLEEGAFAEWQATLQQQAAEHPMMFPARDDVIIPQRAIQVRLFCRSAI